MRDINGTSISLNNLICYQVYGGWRTVKGAFDSSLPKGITIQAIYILKIIEKKDHFLSEIIDILGSDTASMSLITKRMEEKGLIKKIRGSTKDKRSVFVNITKKGTKLLKNNEASIEKTTKQLLKGVSKKEIDKVRSILNKVKQNRINYTEEV